MDYGGLGSTDPSVPNRPWIRFAFQFRHVLTCYWQILVTIAQFHRPQPLALSKPPATPHYCGLKDACPWLKLARSSTSNP